MPSFINNQVDQQVIHMVMEVPLAEAGEAEHRTLSVAIAFLFNWILNLLDTIGGLLINYYPHTIGAIDIPPSSISFIITGLYAFAEMKSQGSDFPFKTHPRSINVAITCLILYGVGSAAEHFISAATRPGSVYSIIARLHRAARIRKLTPPPLPRP